MCKDQHGTHIIFATQQPVELTPELLEILGGKYVKLGNGGTFNPVDEFCNLPEDKKAEFIAEMVKIIENYENERKCDHDCK